MAITRAQQSKQMLQDGGMLVKPSTDGKRPGYRNPNEDRAREEAANQQRAQTFDATPTQVSRANPRDVGFDAREARISKQYKDGITPTDDRGRIIDKETKPNIIDRIKEANKKFQTKANKAYLRRNFDYIAGGRKPLPVLLAIAKSLGDYRFDRVTIER